VEAREEVRADLSLTLPARALLGHKRLTDGHLAEQLLGQAQCTDPDEHRGEVELEELPELERLRGVAHEHLHTLRLGRRDGVDVSEAFDEDLRRVALGFTRRRTRDELLIGVVNCLLQHLPHHRRRTRLLEEAEDPALVDRGEDRLDIGLAGEHHAGGLRRERLRTSQQLRAPHARHAHVGDDHLKGPGVREPRERFDPRRRADHFVRAPQHHAEALGHLLLVIDEQHSRALSAHAAPRRARSARSLACSSAMPRRQPSSCSERPSAASSP